MITTKYYYGQVGQYDVWDPALINVVVICVTRSGTTYYGGSPADNLTYVYQNAFGRILFGNPFILRPPVGLENIINCLEKISVKFKT